MLTASRWSMVGASSPEIIQILTFVLTLYSDYIFAFEPPSGTGYSYYLSTLESLF